MTIVIVIPNLDQGGFLLKALDSVFSQAGMELRVGVLDGGSRDNSLSVIRQYEERLTYWRSYQDRGQAAAINEGITRLGDADYVSWLNSDDLFLPGALNRMAAYLEGHPECVAVFGRAHIIDDVGHVIGEYPTRRFNRKDFARTCTICQPASLIRRSAWQAVGGLDESLHICLDYDLWWRLSRIGRIGFLEQFVACSRDYPLTKTRIQRDRLYEEAFGVVRRHLGYVPWAWCLSETAYGWRIEHGGERANTLRHQFLCACRALRRYLRVNGIPGLIKALH